MPAYIPVAQDTVLIDWYRSEAEVPWQKEPRAQFERERARIGASEAQLANAGIRHLRYHLIKCKSKPDPFFDLHPTQWFSTELSVAEIADATAIDCWERPQCRTVRNIATALPDLLGVRVRSTDLKHRPILVAVDQAQTPILLEGYHRAAGLIHSNEAATIPVFLAVCRNLHDWGFYR